MQLLTVAEVAESLKVKEKTVREWTRKGYLPSIRLGTGGRGRIRFNRDDIQVFIDSQRDS